MKYVAWDQFFFQGFMKLLKLPAVTAKKSIKWYSCAATFRGLKTTNFANAKAKSWRNTAIGGNDA